MNPFHLPDQIAPVVPGWCNGCNVPVLIANRGTNSTVVLRAQPSTQYTIIHKEERSWLGHVNIYKWHACLSSDSIEITDEPEGSK